MYGIQFKSAAASPAHRDAEPNYSPSAGRRQATTE
jgi:hypothetical protein